MATLSEVNETLLAQNKNLELIAEESRETSGSIQTLVQRISEQMEFQERQSLKKLTDKPIRQSFLPTGNLIAGVRETYSGGADGLLEGLLRGLGIGGLAAGSMGIGAFIAGLLGKVLGFIGTGIGRFVRTGILIGAVSAFGEQVINAIFGESLTEDQKDGLRNALYSTAAWVGLGGKFVTGLLAGIISFLFPETSAAAGGLIADGFRSALDTLGLPTGWIDQFLDGENGVLIEQAIGAMAIAFVGRFLLLMGGAAGATVLRTLFLRAVTGAGLIAAFNRVKDSIRLPFGFDDAETPAQRPRPTRPGQQTSGLSPEPPAQRPRPTRPGQQTSGADAVRPRASIRSAPRGFEAVDTPSGTRFRYTEGPNRGRFASLEEVSQATGRNSRALFRIGKLLGVLGLGFEGYRAYSIINDDSLGPREKAAELAGVLGSVSGGISGAVIGGAIGSLALPPVGTLAGGVLGAVLGSMAGDEVANRAARWALGLPQETLSPEQIRVREDLAARTNEFAGVGDGTGFVQPPPTPAATVPYVPNDQFRTTLPISRPTNSAREITEYLMQLDYAQSNTDTPSVPGGSMGPVMVDQSVTNNRAGDNFSISSGGVRNGVDRDDGRFSIGRGRMGLAQ